MKRRDPFEAGRAKRARHNGRSWAQTLEFAFRRRYNLPPTDPRFLNATREEIETDFWAHRYFENPPTEEVVDDDFDQEAIERQWAKEAEQDGLPDDFETVIDTKNG